MAMHGHTFHRIAGYPDTVLHPVLPAGLCGTRAEGSAGQCGGGGSGGSAGMGAVTEELDESVENSLVHGSQRPVAEA